VINFEEGRMKFSFSKKFKSLGKSKSSQNKKGQIEITFHWIYILIAGAVILLFFAGLVVKQKAVSEERLGGEIVIVLDSILAGAGVSEQTKNFINVGGLADYIFEFKCEDDYAGFGIKGGVFEELPLNPIFSPKEIKTSKLILWSLPYELPYKVMDFLIATSINTKYFVIGGPPKFRVELENATTGLNFEFVRDLNEVDPGKNFQIRVVDLGGDIGRQPVPMRLKDLDDTKVTSVSFIGPKQVIYYQKEGSSWKQLGEEIKIISIAEERDAAKYAAIFAGDGENYKCNMMKAFRRMELVSEVYEGKLNNLVDYYNKISLGGGCSNDLKPLSSAFGPWKIQVNLCNEGGTVNYNQYCGPLSGKASEIKELNKNLRNACIGLY
jgi:hypothetical protein